MSDLIDVYPYRVFRNDVRYLVLKRSEDKPYSGQWRMVGGKVERGETAWQAGLRELKEETGCQPLNFWTLPSINHFYDHTSDSIFQIPAFAAEIPKNSKIRLNAEHNSCKWITVNEITHYIKWPEQERLMRLLHKILTRQQIIEDWIIEIT